MSTPCDIHEKLRAERRDIVYLVYLHNPTVNKLASLLSLKMEPSAAHVKMRQRRRPLLMLPNTRLLYQELLFFFHSICSDRCTDAKPGVWLLAFLTQAMKKFHLANNSCGTPTLLPSPTADSYLTGPCSRSSTARSRQNECRRRCRGRGSRRGLGIPPRHRRDCCRRGNPRRRRS